MKTKTVTGDTITKLPPPPLFVTGALVRYKNEIGTIIAMDHEIADVLHIPGHRSNGVKLDDLYPQPLWKDNNPTLVFAMTDGGYWGKGQDLEAAIASCHKEGARGVQNVVIYLYTGTEEELAKIKVAGGGAISYPQTVTSNRIGKVRMPMKQGVTK